MLAVKNYKELQLLPDIDMTDTWIIFIFARYLSSQHLGGCQTPYDFTQIWPAFLAHTRQKFSIIVGLTVLRLAFFMGYE